MALLDSLAGGDLRRRTLLVLVPRSRCRRTTPLNLRADGRARENDDGAPEDVEGFPASRTPRRLVIVHRRVDAYRPPGAEFCRRDCERERLMVCVEQQQEAVV